MADRIWEPLAELELNLYRSKKYSIYCLCSRAFIRSKIEGESWAEFFKDIEKTELGEMEDIPTPITPDTSSQNPDIHNVKKQETEAVSCYCSASHYSTDDYESVMQSTSDHFQSTTKEHLPCPLQNSDSGADLSENFVDKPCCRITEDPLEDLDLNCGYSKSKADLAWEKYWSENGENIIWKSWIEKYGAYINPSYLDQSTLNENFEMETDDPNKQELDDCNRLENFSNETDNNPTNKVNEGNQCKNEKIEDPSKDNLDNIPDLKISSYSSCTNLSDGVDSKKLSMNVDEADFEDKLLKSNSFGSYASYEREEKYANSDEDKIKGFERERVRSRCSNTSLSVKSIANTTVTTDSMTNVTKITLSSLDLSCECESVRSSSLLSTSSEDSSGPTSSSSSSSKEEMCTEADMWWKKVWKEHYQAQYLFCYQSFSKDFDQIKPDESLVEAKQKLLEKVDDMIDKEDKQNITLESSNYLMSVGYILKILDATSLESQSRNEMEEKEGCVKEDLEISKDKVSTEKSIGRSDSLKRRLEHSEDSDNLEECSNEDKAEQSGFLEKKKSYNMEENPRPDKTRKLDNVRQALSLMGYSFRSDCDEIKSGYVTYKKKNIRAQNRRLKLIETKPRTHLFFDDDGNPFFEAKRNESIDTPEPLDEDVDDKKNDNVSLKLKESIQEPESLGYEAHSSSVEDESEAADDNKKQKKKRKKQKKYNNVPPEIVENKNLLKYWLRRYQLFLKFDDGIKLDPESWFSVTPEKVAKHHAERCRCDVIVDAFCGAGGNAIQFAFTCERVIAIDLDPKKIELAKHNAKIYGVEDRIEFMVGDFTKIAHQLKADVVFLSPPWGGPEYLSTDVYSLDKILPPIGGKELYRLATNVSTEVAYFLPRNANSTELALLPGPGGEIEIEQNFLDRKLIALTAYFGELVLDPNDPQLMDE